MQAYDGDGLRAGRTDSGATTYYLRSSVLGGQVVAEIRNSGSAWYWDRGYVYLGSQLLAVQYGGVTWVHQDPVTKSQRATDINGNPVASAAVDTDPWGGETGRSAGAFQPHKFTTYERDANHSDDAQMRRYNRWWSRFDQPDPYDGSYDLSDPQSFNRYSYTRNDPVNYVDPSGLDVEGGTFAIDPATGQIVFIPGFSESTTVSGADPNTITGVGGGVGRGLHPPLQGTDSGDGGGLDAVPKGQKLAPKPPSNRKEYCDQLRSYIMSRAFDLLDDIKRYDPVADGIGGYPHAGGGVTQPGGHFTEITQRQGGLKQDITRYINDCVKNGGGGPSPPAIPHWIDGVVNRQLPLPVIPMGRQPVRGFDPRAAAKAGGAVTAAVILYWIISEGSRIVFPPRNLVPVP